LLSAAAIAALAATAPVAGARTANATFSPCQGVRLSVRSTTPGNLFIVSTLAVSHLSCASAEKAVRAGRFAITPGNPIFSTSGFRCTSPIGPPPDTGPVVRYVVCRYAAHAFRFVRAD